VSIDTLPFLFPHAEITFEIASSKEIGSIKVPSTEK
jgi:hypothetical protein